MTQKRRKSKSAVLRDKIYSDSTCTVAIDGELPAPKSVEIEFRGTLARIPSLKNGKVPGKNFLKAEVKTRLTAMTELYNAFMGERSAKYTGQVFCLIILANSVRADEDNCLASIKDWLEPPIMRNKDRGFGVGLVDNDKNVNGYCVYAKRLNLLKNSTYIRVCPWAQVHNSMVRLCGELSGTGINAAQASLAM